MQTGMRLPPRATVAMVLCKQVSGMCLPPQTTSQSYSRPGTHLRFLLSNLGGEVPNFPPKQSHQINCQIAIGKKESRDSIRTTASSTNGY